MESILRRTVSSYHFWALVVLLACLAVYVPSSDKHVNNQDTRAASLESWRVASTGSPWLDGLDWNNPSLPRYANAATVEDGTLGYAFASHNKDGHIVIDRSPGVVIVSIPFYWLSHAGTSWPDFRFWPGELAANLLVAFAMMLFFLALVRRLTIPVALAATAVLAFGTPMWSVAGSWIWTESVVVLGVAGMAWAADRDNWWLVGIFGGIGLWGRLHVAVILTILGLGMAIWRRDWRPAVRAGVPNAILLVLASVWTHWLYDSWRPTGGYDVSASTVATGGAVVGTSHGFGAHLVNQLGGWVSLDRGLLIWTPVILLLLPALWRSWRGLPEWSRLLIAGGFVYAIIQGQLDTFIGSAGYLGYRLMLVPLACFAPALTLSLPPVGRIARYAIGPLVGVMVGVFGWASVGEPELAQA